jgi:hypothetical protein
MHPIFSPAAAFAVSSPSPIESSENKNRLLPFHFSRLIFPPFSLSVHLFKIMSFLPCVGIRRYRAKQPEKGRNPLRIAAFPVAEKAGFTMHLIAGFFALA